METQGIHGSGQTSYTLEQAHKVLGAIQLASRYGVALTVADLHRATKLSGNAIRAIVRDADGAIMLLGGDGKGYRLATSPEDADQYTERLESQIAAMQVRVARRRAYCAQNW